MREIPLTGKYGVGLVALVDDEDYPLVSRYRWSAKPSIYLGEVYSLYAITRVYSLRDGRVTRMHRLLCPVPDDMTVDHVNGNPLDNRRANLRPATRAQQAWNCGPRRTARGRAPSSGYKGVYPYAAKTGVRWTAKIRVHGCQNYLGVFSTEIEAALAYDTAARQHFGEFARLNVAAEPSEIMLASG